MVTLLVAIAITVAMYAEPEHRTLAREAQAAFEAKNHPLFLEKISAASALRPDYPRYLLVLARADMLNERPDDAFANLTRLAGLGVYVPIAARAEFGPLKVRPEFSKLVAQFEANRAPAGAAEAIFELPAQAGILEGLTFRAATGDWFLSDVRQRCIWRRDRNGAFTRFSGEGDELPGVFGLALDEKRGALWAAVSAIEQMRGYTAEDQGHCGLAEYDLASGELRRVVDFPTDGRPHVLGDLTVADDGTVYTSDSLSPALWKLGPGDIAPEKILSTPDFVSLQGLTLVDGGRALLVADYANGLWRVDLATSQATLLPAPAGTTLLGIDGLYATRRGIIAVQNGIEPQRVILISLGADGKPSTVAPLAAAQPGMTDLGLGTIAGDTFAFIGNSGWSLYDPAPTTDPAPRAVTILRTQ
jgi:sugar lactone lactonase YvrE